MKKSITELFSWWKHRVAAKQRYGSKHAVAISKKIVEPKEHWVAPDGVVCSSIKELLEYIAAIQGNYWR